VGGFGLGARAGSGRGSNACPRGTMTASSNDERVKLHRDAVLHAVLLHAKRVQTRNFRYPGRRRWYSCRLPKRDHFGLFEVNAFAS
jgi:hypothetical protein